MTIGRNQQRDPAIDPDPRFTVHGSGPANYTSPWDYLLVAILLTAVGIGIAVFIGWNTATDPGFGVLPAVLVAVVVVGGPIAVGGWALRRFARWRRARLDYASATGTSYRGIFTRSEF